MVRRTIVPDEQFWNRGSQFSQGLDESDGILLPMPLAQDSHELAGLNIERGMDHAPTIAPADFHQPLDAFPGPGRPQGRELAQCTLVADPDLSARSQYLLGAFAQSGFF